jgi:hypothetical protein
VRLWGTKTVTKMVNDGDLSTLPDNLIVLYAAAEILARDGAKDAELKLQPGQRGDAPAPGPAEA